MRDAKTIKAEIRDLKREMKDSGIRVTSCFNGGHTPVSYRMNCDLFRLKVELEQAQKATA